MSLSEKQKEYKRQWYHAHREEELTRRRARKEEIYRKRRAMARARRLEVLEMYGLECAHCGFSDIRALQIDHVNGGGHQERKKLGEYKQYARVKQFPDEYQLLCANCNWIKRYENNEHSGN